MIGFITNRNSHEFRIPDHLVFTINIDQQKFIVEGSGYLFSLQKLKPGFEYDFLITEFDEPSQLLSPMDDAVEIDQELVEMINDENWQLQQDLQEFRRLETILKAEGII